MFICLRRATLLCTGQLDCLSAGVRARVARGAAAARARRRAAPRADQCNRDWPMALINSYFYAAFTHGTDSPVNY